MPLSTKLGKKDGSQEEMNRDCSLRLWAAGSLRPYQMEKSALNRKCLTSSHLHLWQLHIYKVRICGSRFSTNEWKFFSEVKNGNCLIKNPDMGQGQALFCMYQDLKSFLWPSEEKVKLVIFRYSSGEKEDPWGRDSLSPWGVCAVGLLCCPCWGRYSFWDSKFYFVILKHIASNNLVYALMFVHPTCLPPSCPSGRCPSLCLVLLDVSSC